MENSVKTFLKGEVNRATPNTTQWCVTNDESLQTSLTSQGYRAARDSEIEQLRIAGVQIAAPGFGTVYGSTPQSPQTSENQSARPAQHN